MAWARYDDELPMNKKIGYLIAQGPTGVAALGLHLLANTWSRHNGTAGAIPSHQPGILVGSIPLGRKLAHVLHQAGMFDVTAEGWMIHNFDEFSDPNDDGRSAAERKRDLSEKRAQAGSKGGKQTASKRTGLLEANEQQCSSPVPEPVPHEQVSDNSTPENTPEGGDNSRTEATIECYVRIALEQAYRRGQVMHEQGYAKAARRTAIAHPDIARYLDLFPTAPASAVAAWLHGEKQSMAYYPRVDELASVHELHRGTA